MILLLFAHPYPSRSRACKALFEAARDVANIRIHSLYERYADFDIDVAAEQALLRQADRIVALHPIYWYAPPGLFKHWLDKVLVRGFAYGPGGDALHGKSFLWAPTTGGDDAAYSPEGLHVHPFAAFTTPMEQTVRYCGMHWEKPFPLHGAHVLSDDALSQAAQTFRARLASPRGHAD